MTLENTRHSVQKCVLLLNLLKVENIVRKIYHLLCMNASRLCRAKQYCAYRIAAAAAAAATTVYVYMCL